MSMYECICIVGKCTGLYIIFPCDADQAESKRSRGFPLCCFRDALCVVRCGNFIKMKIYSAPLTHARPSHTVEASTTLVVSLGARDCVNGDNARVVCNV